jgi:mono/diheme cytochrome c family protein
MTRASVLLFIATLSAAHIIGGHRPPLQMLSRPFSAQTSQQNGQATSASSRSVWDGVYTADQALRGKTQYETNCGLCHGADLAGGRGGQPLKGETFMRSWSGYSVNGFFSRVKSTMPSGAPGSLSESVYLDIVAHTLQSNGFPSGRSELKTEGLENVRIEGRDGPQPVPNYALVRVVGCLIQSSGNSWVLSSASEPVRTRNPEASKDEELKDSMAKVLGKQSIPLRSIYPAPDPYRGHKVEAKGFLIKSPNDSHINVNSMQTLASNCVK